MTRFDLGVGRIAQATVVRSWPGRCSWLCSDSRDGQNFRGGTRTQTRIPLGEAEPGAPEKALCRVNKLLLLSVCSLRESLPSPLPATLACGAATPASAWPGAPHVRHLLLQDKLALFSQSPFKRQLCPVQTSAVFWFIQQASEISHKQTVQRPVSQTERWTKTNVLRCGSNRKPADLMR